MPDAIVSGSLKYHISFLRPSSTTSAFLDALEEHKLPITITLNLPIARKKARAGERWRETQPSQAGAGERHLPEDIFYNIN